MGGKRGGLPRTMTACERSKRDARSRFRIKSACIRADIWSPAPHRVLGSEHTRPCAHACPEATPGDYAHTYPAVAHAYPALNHEGRVCWDGVLGAQRQQLLLHVYEHRTLLLAGRVRAARTQTLHSSAVPPRTKPQKTPDLGNEQHAADPSLKCDLESNPEPRWILAPCGKPYRTRGGNKKPLCVSPRSRLRFTLKSRCESRRGLGWIRDRAPAA